MIGTQAVFVYSIYVHLNTKEFCHIAHVGVLPCIARKSPFRKVHPHCGGSAFRYADRNQFSRCFMPSYCVPSTGLCFGRDREMYVGFCPEEALLLVRGGETVMVGKVK